MMLPTLQKGLAPDDLVVSLPQVNISLSVRDHDALTLGGMPSEGGHGTNSGEVMEWVLPPSEPWSSAGQVAAAVLVVFVLSAVIICSNALILVAVYRFKRLRNPSNYFVASLASADFGIGLMLPPGLYFEFTRTHIRCVMLCLLPYCLFILLCSVALLSMTAVAVDRCTSLASPLRYNNIITHGSVVRYIAGFWMYSLLLSSSPLLYWLATKGDSITEQCFLPVVVPSNIRVFLFAMLFAPCAILMTGSYGYVYVVARSHARAIFSAELSFRQHPLSGPRYGRTLAATVGLFCLLWIPFQVVVFSHDTIHDKTVFYLGILALSSAATDPWIYGYRSAEFRIASLRIIETVLPQLSGALYKPQVRRTSIPFTSCASHTRIGLSPNPVTHTADTMCATFLEIPVVNRQMDSTAAAQV